MTENKTDFNDLRQAEGLDAVKKIIDGGQDSVEDQSPVSDIVNAPASAVQSTKPLNFSGAQKASCPLDQYTALAQMNERYSIVRESGKTIVVYEEDDPLLSRRVLIRSAFTDIEKYYKVPVLSGYLNGKPQYTPLGKFWLNHPEAKRYFGVVFSPNSASPGKYNLWRGYAVEPRPGCWSLLHEHMLNNICRADEDHFDYFMGWLALLFQQPGTPGHTAIVLRGGRGTGKSFMATILIRMIGQHSIHISTGRHLTGNFNSHLQDVIFIFSDEAFWAGDKAGESVLKALITEPRIVIEPKGINSFQVPNFIHLMMASNSEWVIPAGHDERRYFVLDVGSARQQDSAYFSAIKYQMENGGYEAFLHDLLQYDLSGFDVRRVPQTQALFEQKLHSLRPEEQWWLDILMEGRLPEDEDIWSGIVSKQGLADHFSLKLGKAGESRRKFETQLGMKIRKMVPEIISNEYRKREVYDQYRKVMVSRDVPVYIFPPLEVCRAGFDAMIRGKIDWPAPYKKPTDLFGKTEPS